MATESTTADPAARTARPSALRRLGHRWPTWVALALVGVTFGDGEPPLGFLAGLLVFMPLCYLAFGAFRGEFGGESGRRGLLALQLAGLLGFAGLAAVALSTGEPAARWVVAAGWLAHAVWDFVHHRTGRVVPRAWSEWCCVVDLLGAVGILLPLWWR
ncbi:hypothetical protein AR457_03225 [Streptomyces agglomeratus]|uniref:Uncharacterized protein n=1 Tax=Streptomyces agglomeratus TaxID=285458 RepID=A0A1E5P285_9ACTN|nr:hypothetical protein [Streptomyces agglomeratus]OEJ23651.1 hypothetical protein AS594_03330 [Streptomyces agglomeratus]OEJ43243.1 hypothetical protein AR457_03225 [Streptomyces agglomeratus]OEJ54836.1 hypothetical protein BGK72_32545 [Streptomyces agglomeratus]